jgi:hypothetical protein
LTTKTSKIAEIIFVRPRFIFGARLYPISSNLTASCSPGENVFWKVPVPLGNSSPVIAGERIYLTGFEAVACNATLIHKDPDFEILSHRVAMKALPYKNAK